MLLIMNTNHIIQTQDVSKEKTFLKKRSRGFTLIELMISMTIFSVLITIGLGAVLNIMRAHTMSQNMRSAMDNLNFIMEDMSRNMRLGTNFHCFDVGGHVSDTDTGLDGFGVPIPRDCSFSSNGVNNKIVFSGVSGQTISYIITPPSDGTIQIEKKVGSGSWQVLTPTAITINYFKSGFVVVGAPQGDGLQPVVNITLSGSVLYQGVNKSDFSIQTTVASRPLDG